MIQEIVRPIGGLICSCIGVGIRIVIDSISIPLQGFFWIESVTVVGPESPLVPPGISETFLSDNSVTDTFILKYLLCDLFLWWIAWEWSWPFIHYPPKTTIFQGTLHVLGPCMVVFLSFELLKAPGLSHGDSHVWLKCEKDVEMCRKDQCCCIVIGGNNI